MTNVAMRPSVGDTPRSAYGVLDRRVTAATLAILLGLAGLAWWATVGNVREMESMVQGFAHVGVAMPFDMSATMFLSMWATMMVAMMFPTVGPIVLAHLGVGRSRGTAVPTITFGCGYLLVWVSIGVIPLVVLIAFRHVDDGSAWVGRTGGAVLLVAGVYQFTRWKDTCLRVCRSPFAFVSTHDFGAGPIGAFRAGLSHGLYCLGCCWALMTVLLVVGVMNLVWMAAIAVVLLAEKNWQHGHALSKVVGAAVLGFGLAALVHPALLDSIVPLKDGASMMTGA